MSDACHGLGLAMQRRREGRRQEPDQAHEQRFECGAVLFDLDGVLVDSRSCVLRHWEKWAERHNLALADIMRSAHGVRTIDTIRRVAPELDAAREAALFAAAEVADTEGVVALEGAAGLLNSLPRGAWGVVTSGSRELAMARLRTAGLPAPGVLVSGDEVVRGKPDPEGYLTGADRLGIAPDVCVAVEDAPAGIEASRAAGMAVLGISTTHSREMLHCRWVVDSLAAVRVVTAGEHALRLTMCIDRG